jgi:osmoprotectant transport system permease protein
LRLLLCWIMGFMVLAGSQSMAHDVSGQTLRIGSKRFTESYILAQIMAQTAAPHLARPPSVLQGLGNTAIVYQALRSGSIDMYPEYAGTIALEILKSPGPMSLEDMRRGLATVGLGVAIPLGFNDGYALTMRARQADSLGIHSLSDLARHPELRLGLSNEFIGRADGWAGLAQRYGFRQAPQGLDHGLAYDAIEQGRTDVIDIYTTDAKIDTLGLRVLDDDKHYFPRYDALVLYRLDVPERFPQAWAALQKLSGSIDEKAMIQMNAAAELKGQSFDAIARGYLAVKAGGAAATPAQDRAPSFWNKLFGPDLARLTLQHLGLVAVSVLVAALIAVPVGVLLTLRPRARTMVLGATGMLQTIPSLAMLAALIWLSGSIGTVPALLALTLYALLPIMRNTCTGLAEVPAGLSVAAEALGMTRGQSLYLIELPLAWPTIVAGIRTATSISIGTATIAAFIGAGGYGERIVTGLALNDHLLLLAGAIPAAVLALIAEALFEGIEVWLRRGRGQ